MKSRMLKRVLTVALSLAVMSVMFLGGFIISAETVFYQTTTVDYSATGKMNADNWNTVEDSTGTSLITYAADGKSVTLKTDYSVGVIAVVGRIAPKLPTNARITKVSYTVETKAEGFSRPLDAIYNYESASSWKAVGLAKDALTERNNTHTTTSNWGGGYTKLGVSTTPASFVYDATYTYNAAGAASVALNITHVNDNNKVYARHTSTAASVPCAVLSGGSVTGSNANAYGTYTNVKVTYETPIDAGTIVDDFKVQYPISNIADVTIDNAISCGQAANRALIAMEELAEPYKSMLASSVYASECRAVAIRADVLTTLEYRDDFNDAARTKAAFSAENPIWSVENGVMKVNNTVSGSQNNTAVLDAGNMTGLSMISGKFYAGDGRLTIAIGTQRVMEIQGLVKGPEVNGVSPITSFRLFTFNRSGGSQECAAANINYTGATTTGLSDSSGWLRFVIAFDNSDMPAIYIYSGDTLLVRYVLASAFGSGSGNWTYNADRTQPVGVWSSAGFVGYFDDLRISYNGIGLKTNSATAPVSNTLVKPMLRGASILTTTAQGAQDLRFTLNFDTAAAQLAGYTPVEYGVMMMTDSKLAKHDGMLTMSALGQGGIALITGKATLGNGETIPSEYYVKLKNSSLAGSSGQWDSTSLVGKRFAARAYVAYKDAAGHIYYAYSCNATADDTAKTAAGVANGQASKSIVGVAKSIATVEISLLGAAVSTDGTYTVDQINAILDPLRQTTTTADERVILFDFITRNASAAGL